jgi:hypothetical protein
MKHVHHVSAFPQAEHTFMRKRLWLSAFKNDIAQNEHRLYQCPLLTQLWTLSREIRSNEICTATVLLLQSVGLALLLFRLQKPDIEMHEQVARRKSAHEACRSFQSIFLAFRLAGFSSAQSPRDEHSILVQHYCGCLDLDYRHRSDELNVKLNPALQASKIHFVRALCWIEHAL